MSIVQNGIETATTFKRFVRFVAESWAYEPAGGWGTAPPPNLAVQFFWAMTKIWTEGVFGVSNTALIHTERAHANFVLENEMERMIDIFGSRIDRDSYFF